MEIVITDGYTLSQGDLNWDALSAFGEIRYYDRTPPELTRERCHHASVIVTNKTPIGREIIEQTPTLKLIAVAATGYNMVDISAARSGGIPVCNVPGYGTDSVAQHSFALLLELANKTGLHIQSVRNGDWARSPDWCYSKAPLIELKDKTIGIIGPGRIGQQVGLIARAFGMRVIYYTRTLKNIPWAEPVPLEALFKRSDFISIHCPLTAENVAFINIDYLSMMKTTAYLINTSRGALINEDDLVTALNRGLLAGAALDVLVSEPPLAGHPLIGHPNCLITPHNAWLSVEARIRVLKTTYDNIRDALAGAPKNVVN
jgi:glycerate dehydrogenase